MKILVVEDDRLLNNTLCYNLIIAGHYTHLGFDDAKDEMVRLEELEVAKKEVEKVTSEKPSGVLFFVEKYRCYGIINRKMIVPVWMDITVVKKDRRKTMKRDVDLIRKILFYVEENYVAGGPEIDVHIDGYSDSVIYEHCILMKV